jgi:PAS domain S-box-containing protein
MPPDVIDFAKLFEFSRDIGFIVDLKGSIIAATGGAERALVYERGALVGALLPALDASGEIVRLLSRGLDAHLRLHVGFTLESRDGRTVAVDAVASSLWDPEGRPAGWFIAGQDLPGAVAESREARTILGALVDSMQAAVWSFDANGRVVTWGRGAEAAFGFGREAAEGRLHAGELFAALGDLERARDEVDRKGQFAGEIPMRHRDGSLRHHQVSLTPLRSGDRAVGYTSVSFDVTERRQREDLFELLFRKSTNALYLVDGASLRIVEANDAACRMLGYEREEFLSLSVPDLVPPELRSRIPGVRRQAEEGSAPLRERRMLLRKDGRSIPTDHAIARLDFGGKLHFLASVHDLSGLEQAVRESKEAKEFLEALQENAGEGIVILDDRGVIVSANRKMLEMQGLSREGFVGHSFTEFAPPEELGAWSGSFQEVKERGQSRIRTTATMATGRKLNLEVASAAIFQGGRPYVFAIIRDVTEDVKRREDLERRVEERTVELKRSELRMRAVAESSLDAIVGSDSEGRITYWNPQAERLFGWSREEVLGKTLEETLIPPERLKGHLEGMRSYARSSRGTLVNRRMELSARRRDGGEFPIELCIASYRIDEGLQFTAFISDITERKAAEAAVRKAREELERRVADRTRDLANANEQLRISLRTLERMTQEQGFLLRHTRDFVYRQDLQGGFSYLSPAVESITGFNPDEWRSRSWTLLTDHPDNRRVAEIRDEMLRSGKRVPPFRMEVYHKTGRRLVLEVSEQAYFEEGAVAGVVGVARDVTERCRAEERQAVQHAVARILEESPTSGDALPRILRAITEGLHWPYGALWTGDGLDGHTPCCLRVKAVVVPADGDAATRGVALRDRTCPPDRELAGRIWSSGRPLWMPDTSDDAEGSKREDWSAAGVRAAFGIPVRTAAGPFAVLEFLHREPRTIELEVVDLLANLGKQIGQFVDRRRAEQDLRYQKSLLESQSEAAIDGILVVSNEGVMVSFNRRFLEMWDIPREVAQSRTDEHALQSVLDKLVDPKEFLERVSHLYAHPEEVSRDEIRLKDGRTFDRYSAPVRDDEGVIYGRVWYFRDVTGRKKTEENLRRAAEETRRAYEDLQRTQEQLIRSEKLASIGMLVSGVAHEINNPLNVMYGNLQLLKEACDAAMPEVRKALPGGTLQGRIRKVHRMIEDALRAGRHARGVIDDFRNFARDVRKAEPVDLNRCIDEVLTLVRQDLRPGIRIVCRFGRIPLIRCLRGQMSQVFLNLVRNAAESIEKKGSITLRTRKQDRSVRVEVSDTGRGMSEEVLKKLFEPFFTTKEVGKGLGLGLSISAMIVHNHGGALKARSRPGQGSTFSVELPLTS